MRLPKFSKTPRDNSRAMRLWVGDVVDFVIDETKLGLGNRSSLSDEERLQLGIVLYRRRQPPSAGARPALTDVAANNARLARLSLGKLAQDEKTLRTENKAWANSFLRSGRVRHFPEVKGSTDLRVINEAYAMVFAQARAHINRVLAMWQALYKKEVAMKQAQYERFKADTDELRARKPEIPAEYIHAAQRMVDKLKLELDSF